MVGAVPGRLEQYVREGRGCGTPRVCPGAGVVAWWGWLPPCRLDPPVGTGRTQGTPEPGAGPRTGVTTGCRSPPAPHRWCRAWHGSRGRPDGLPPTRSTACSPGTEDGWDLPARLRAGSGRRPSTPGSTTGPSRRCTGPAQHPDATITTSQEAFLGPTGQGLTFADAIETGAASASGDGEALRRLRDLFHPPSPHARKVDRPWIARLMQVHRVVEAARLNGIGLHGGERTARSVSGPETTKGKRTAAPYPSQHIAHRGPCGKALVVLQNLQPRTAAAVRTAGLRTAARRECTGSNGGFL